MRVPHTLMRIDIRNYSHPSRRWNFLGAAGALFVGTLLLAACVTTTSTPPNTAKTPTKPVISADAPRVGPDALHAMGTVIGSGVSMDVRALGTITTDGFTLPLLSPSGQFIAVQTGTPPDGATMLARAGQRAPKASRIAMYRVAPTGLVRLGETDSGLVLGRNSDARGFLVESPRPDGARWIGRLEWGKNDIEWLVQDGRVNAFASLGIDGALTYSSRDVRERQFDLVVQRNGKVCKLLGDGARSYLFPTFNSDGSRVFAMCARDGILEFASADPTSDESLTQSLTRALISDRADDQTAAQMLAPQGVRDGIDGRDWIAFHPALNSLVRWNDADGLRPINGGVMALGRVSNDRVAVLAGGRVRVRALDASSEELTRDPGTVILDEVAVPRAMEAMEGRPTVLFVVPHPGGVKLLLARFMGG